MENPLKEFVIQNYQEVKPSNMQEHNNWRRDFIGRNLGQIEKLARPFSAEEVVGLFNQMCEVRDQLVHNFGKGIPNDF